MRAVRGTRSAWGQDAPDLLRPALSSDADTDVCIVGAGVVGMLCAYSLARAGHNVVVLDQGPIGGGETGRTTAHLANAIDDRYSHIERLHGLRASRVCADSHTAAISLFERIAVEERIPCGLMRLDGYLFLPPGEREDLLREELQAAHNAGLTRVELLPRAPSFPSGPCLRFPDQGQLDPLRFLAGVAVALERLGGRVFGATRVERIQGGRPLTVRTCRRLAVRARSVIVATNSPSNDLVTMHTKQAAYRTYAISARAPIGGMPPALYWDTSEKAGDEQGPYHYARVDPGAAPGGDDLVIIGGGDHLMGEQVDPGERWRQLESWGRVHWPFIGDVVHRWSGQVMEPLDGVAFIGRNPTGPDGVFIVTGDSGMGMTHAGVAAIMMPALVRGDTHPWEKTYNPARKPFNVLGEFAKHAGRMTAHYADWLTPGADVDEIAPGEGRVIRRGLHLIAAYRDAENRLHARSAVCTHLGCIVRWNTAEKSWDCPCHGSRFDAMGKMLHGPAIRDLARRPLKEAGVPAAPPERVAPIRTPGRAEPQRERAPAEAPAPAREPARSGDRPGLPLDQPAPGRSGRAEAGSPPTEG